MLSGQHVSALPRCQRQRVTVLLAASVSLALALILVVSSLHRGSSVLVANVGVVSEGRSASPLRKYVSEGSDVRVFPVDSPASAELPAAAPLQALLQAEGRHAIAESLAALAFYEKCPLNHADYKYDAALFHPIIRRSLANWRAAGLTNRSIDTVWMTRTSNLHAPLWYSVRRGVVYQRVHPSVEEEPVYHGHVMDLIRAAAGLKPTPPDSELVLNPWDHPKVPVQDLLPVFTWVTTPAHADIMFPGPMPWTQGISEPGPYPYLLHLQSPAGEQTPLASAASASSDAASASTEGSDANHHNGSRWPTWSPLDAFSCNRSLAERKGAAFWRGSPNGPTAGFQGSFLKHYQRVRAGILSAQHPDLVNASLTDVQALAAAFPDDAEPSMWPHANDMSNAGECEHRYVLNIAGNTAIARTARLFVRGVVIWVQHPFEEFWHSAFVPWQDYIPAASDLSDVPAIVSWLNEHPDVAERVHANGAAKARRIARRETWICYWWHLLHEYGSLFPKDFVARRVRG